MAVWDRVAPPAIAALVTLVAAAAMAYGATAGPDELTYMSHARRLLAGEAPYRDFFEFTPPLVMWLGAAVVGAFGPSLLAARLVQAVALAAAAALATVMARRLGAGPVAAVLPGLALPLALYPLYPYWSYHWLVLVPLLGCALAAMRGLTTETPRPWLMAGGLAGLCALFLQSDGALAGILVASSAVAGGLVGGAGARRTASRLAWAGLGLLAPLALAAVVLAAQGALTAAWDLLVGWTLTHYRQPGGVNDIRYGTDVGRFLALGAEWAGLPRFYARAYHGAFLLALLPLAAVGAGAWLLGIAWRRLAYGLPWTEGEARASVAALLAIGAAGIAYLGRADAEHAAMYALPALVAAAALATRWATATANPALVAVRALPHLALAAFVATGALGWADAARRPGSAWEGWRGPDAAHREAPLIRWLADHARPGDRVVGFPASGALTFYALPPGHRYTLILPGVGYMDNIEFAAVRQDLAARGPRFLVFVPFAADAITRPDLFGTLLTGYREAARVPEPLPGLHAPALVYERAATITK